MKTVLITGTSGFVGGALGRHRCSTRSPTIMPWPGCFWIGRGEEFLGRYHFNTHTAEHYFCTRCGIYTHHRRRANPREYGFNVGCLEGVDPFELGEVPVADGVHHPADRAE